MASKVLVSSPKALLFQRGGAYYRVCREHSDKAYPLAQQRVARDTVRNPTLWCRECGGPEDAGRQTEWPLPENFEESKAATKALLTSPSTVKMASCACCASVIPEEDLYPNTQGVQMCNACNDLAPPDIRDGRAASYLPSALKSPSETIKQANPRYITPTTKG